MSCLVNLFSPQPDSGIHHGDDSAYEFKCPSSVNRSSNATGPDGRLSWTIAVTCFVINFIASGFYRCTGLFFSSIMETFGASRGDASFPVSLYGAFYYVTGNVAYPCLFHTFLAVLPLSYLLLLY
ncbi:hypothetical protein HPB51_015811 [Rhipicephalus microplus]|uniref:Monocarboxylate transporter n=1 Tax=Rhipicephalus microplus TaxID=6941 RepID=A0A9J6F4E5_RHIMP|nr:hypothetical protein HPB51_015811 [Rhipicephalus microplus]